MRFSIVVALFASALVLAAPIEQGDQLASYEQYEQADATALMEEYAQLEGMEQDAEFIGPIIRAAAKIIPKVIRAIGRGGAKAAKAVKKHGSDVVDTAADVADAATQGQDQQ